MKKLIGCFLALALICNSDAQNTRYIVTFSNKAGSPHAISNPSTFLSQRAINRRTSYGIAIDSTDLPVTPRYIDSLRFSGPVVILNSSRWLNAVTIRITDSASITPTLAKINSLPFVQSVTGIALRPQIELVDNKFHQEETIQLPSEETGTTADVFNYGQSFNQVHMHNGEFLHNIGLRGQGMIMGLLDAGFFGYLTLKAFDSARANGQILGVYDFVAKDSSVNEDISHGMQCLSTIAANIPSQFVGTGPKASFYLFRTEDGASEYPIEEFNWVCGAERLDSAGGDVLSSSLGYNTFNSPFASFNHSYAEMNGNTTTVTKGADLAAKKGILVVNSAGNEGNNSWKYIIAPADGDSVMAVGAVDSNGKAANFTSLGPSSDGQVKPDVASKGVNVTVQFTNNTIGKNNGTSFAAPNLAGLTTCLWQGFKEYNNMKIIDALRKSGNRASNPNDSIGYGVPDVKKATIILLKSFATSNASVSDCKTNLSWTSKDVHTMKYEIERRNPGAANYEKVGEVSGTGTLFATHNYQFQDPIGGLSAGTISYRIRQVVDTSVAGFAADYIDTITVSLMTNCAVITAIDPLDTNFDISLVPNPARDHFTVRINTPGSIHHLKIDIIDSKGQTVSSLKKTKPIGPAAFELGIGHLARGKYYVTIYDGPRLLATKELIRL